MNTLINFQSLHTVGLTTEQAERFKIFMQHYNEFACIIDTQIFQRVRPGKVILHLNQSGEIGKIELHPTRS